MGLAVGLAGNGELEAGGGGGGAPTIQGTAGANLGATATINFGGVLKEIWLVGTLNANLTVTFSNYVAGCKSLLILTQDGTGSRTLTISDGSNPTAVGISSSAGALAMVAADFPDATNIDAAVLGGGGAIASVFGRTGTVAATSGDYTASQVTNAADKSSSSQQNFTGELKTPDLSLAGLTGATTGGRIVGFTGTGSPSTGTFLTNDWAFDGAGAIWRCSSGGTPGTWVAAGGGGALSVDGGSSTSTFVTSIDGGTSTG